MRDLARLHGASCVTAMLLALAGGVFAASREAEQLGDEAFIESLEDQREGRVDLNRLAKLLFSVASTLDGGRTSARLLQSVAPARDPAANSSRTALEHRYGAYEGAVAGFKGRVSRLLDEPDSAARLYLTLTEGHRACWQLDNYTRSVQSYGASAPDMISMLSSIEACRLFRRAAFHPRVEGVIAEALTSRRGGSDEVRELREELRAMEELLEDLRRIDEEEP